MPRTPDRKLHAPQAVLGELASQNERPSNCIHRLLVKYFIAPFVFTILAPCGGLLAQDGVKGDPRLEFMGAYSFNTDFVRNQPVLVVADQKVSPFFSNGSGPFGFEASIKRYVRGPVGIKATLSGYFDPYFEGTATYCQPTSCAQNVHAKATPRTFYAMFGPEWKFRRAKRFSPFIFATVGIVYERSTFELDGSNVQYANGFHRDGLIVFTSAGFPQNGTVRYSDSSTDVGPAIGLGAGFDTRISKRLSFRVAMDYDPTFLVRPAITNPTLFQPTPSSRYRQDHVALSLGLVWGIH